MAENIENNKIETLELIFPKIYF